MKNPDCSFMKRVACNLSIKVSIFATSCLQLSISLSIPPGALANVVHLLLYLFLDESMSTLSKEIHI